MDQLRQGGSFVGYARQFSESSTAAAGGDLGFVRLEMLPSELAVAARQMQVGQLIGPIENSGGFSLLALIDKRAVLMADPRDAVLSLKQISHEFPRESPKPKRNPNCSLSSRGLARCAVAAPPTMSPTRWAPRSPAATGSSCARCPTQIQAMLLDLQIGQVTPPFGGIEDGVSVLMLCGRDDPQESGAPSFDDLMSQLEDDRINKRAQRYLRDLRNDAVIEYN